MYIVAHSRFLVVKRTEVFDKWSDDWEVTFQEICGLLSVRENAIDIPVMEDESVRLYSGFHSSFLLGNWRELHHHAPC